MDVLKLLGYHHHLWREFAQYYVDSCTWEELSRNHESSHNTIANVTMHAVNMEDWWLHYVIPGKPWDGPKWDGFTSAPQMLERVKAVEAKTKKLLAGKTPADLAQAITFEAYGEKTSTTLENVIMEVVNEAAHHRGEVIAMLWRTDKEPPYGNFLEYLASRPK